MNEIKDNLVKIYTRCGNDKQLVNETDMRLFKSNMRIHGREGRYLIVFGTSEGGAELDIPKNFAKDLVGTMLDMMDITDSLEILTDAAERYK